MIIKQTQTLLHKKTLSFLFDFYCMHIYAILYVVNSIKNNQSFKKRKDVEKIHIYPKLPLSLSSLSLYLEIIALSCADSYQKRLYFNMNHRITIKMHHFLIIQTIERIKNYEKNNLSFTTRSIRFNRLFKKDNEMNHEFYNEFVYYHAYGSEHYRNDTPVIDDNTIDKVANQKKSLMFYHFIFLKQIMYKTKKHLLRVNAT